LPPYKLTSFRSFSPLLAHELSILAASQAHKLS
jgi:hypothetical protein